MHGTEVVRLARTILPIARGAPIVAQPHSGRIIGGHGRPNAPQSILATLEVDGEPRGGVEHLFDRDAPGPVMVPVRLGDVSDARPRAPYARDRNRATEEQALFSDLCGRRGRAGTSTPESAAAHR